ncbi:helix-turn-helix transcriptional regulator [Natronobacterium lacisalsi]|uniref:helix-turn-helix transcriptional regulator n=1 Tax=Natronobacterium lacisalsi TaxID=229731 RepID=UPI001268D740|nr:hypothetical protein [Halobiforma lacisalsi]
MESSITTREEVLKKRNNLLENLLTEPQTKAQLIENTGRSRSTIDRGIKSLQEQGCVQYKNGRYHITQTGKISHKEYTRHRQVLQGIEEANEILKELPSQPTISTQFIKNINVNVADPKAPGIVLKESYGLVREADQLFRLAPVIMPAFSKNLLETVKKSETSIEVVIEADVLDTVEKEDDSEVSTIIAHPNTTFHKFDGELPFSLWITKGDQDYVGINMYNQDGLLGVLINKSEEAVSWGISTFENYRKQSTHYD